MRWVVIAAMCLSACNADPTPSAGQNESAAMPGNAIVAPIAPAATPQAPEASQAPAPPEPKPLVSRETSSRLLPPPDYRAIGTEPFWAVTVRGEILLLQRPDQPTRRYRVKMNVEGNALRYTGEGFAMTATAGPCNDGMSDNIWSDRVQIAFAQGALKGCGGELEGAAGAP